MKKAMLFIVALLFSVSASAATMSWTSVPAVGGVIDKDNSTQLITAHVGHATSVGAHLEQFSFNVDAAKDVWSVAIEFLDRDFSIASVDLDGAAFSFDSALGLGKWSLGFTSLVAGAHTISLYVNSAIAGAQLSVKVGAVPVPAALFLFAPALLGFLGLRRKATLAA